MRNVFGVALAATLVCGFSGPVRAENSKEAIAIVDKAIKAAGGEEALGKIKAASWKTKITFTVNDNDVQNSSATTMQGLDHYRQVLEGEFNGMPFKMVVLLAGDKGIRKVNDNQSDLDKEAIANQKRAVYLAVVPITLLPLKSKDFKLETIDDEKIGDKPAAGLKVTAPDGKDFKLYFDKETGLPVRMVAKVAGFQPGQDFTQETNYSEYKEMAGIKKATKIEAKRDGMKFMKQEITEFKALEKVDPKTFTEQ